MPEPGFIDHVGIGVPDLGATKVYYDDLMSVLGQLAENLGLRHIEIDALHHGPNWEPSSREELRERVAAGRAKGR